MGGARGGPSAGGGLRGRALALGGAAVWFGPGLAPHAPAVCDALGIGRRLPEEEHGVALTFDDGPHPEGTPAVLATLAAAGARAIFFLVGEQVERYRSLAAEIAAAGHEIAVHGHVHRNQMRLGPSVVADDLDRALATIGGITGRTPVLHRPPYGIYTPAGLAISRRAGLTPLLWSKWGRDWRERTSAGEIAALATRSLSDGDVLLLHDADWYSAHGSHRRTAAALPLILAEIERRGLQPAGWPGR